MEKLNKNQKEVLELLEQGYFIYYSIFKGTYSLHNSWYEKVKNLQHKTVSALLVSNAIKERERVNSNGYNVYILNEHWQGIRCMEFECLNCKNCKLF